MAKYKVLIDSTERTPKNIGSIGISYERVTDNGAFFVRKKLSGSLTFTGADYAYFAGISDICQSIDVEIQKSCGGSFVTIFEGETSITKCEFQTDICTVKCEVKTIDEYTCLLDNLDKEFNWLAEPNDIEVEISDLQTFEYLVSNSAFVTDWDEVDNYTTSGVPETFYVYARKRVAVPCVGGVPQTPDDDGSGETWTLLTNNCASGGYAIYWRGLNPTEESLLQLALSYQECILPSCPSGAPPPANSTYLGDATGATRGVTVYLLNNSVTKTTVPNGRNLTNVINWALNEIGCTTLSLGGDFFINATNPVTGTTSKTDDLILYDKGDVIRPDATEKAAINNLTFAQLLKDLSTLFNVRWYIDASANELVIDHISDIPSPSGVDLTVAPYDKYIEKKNSYSYTNVEIPLEEKFKFPVEARSVDFTGLPIIYNTTCNETNEIIYQTERLETEFNRYYKNEDEGADGIILVSPFTLNNADEFSSKAENGRISGLFIPNAPLGYPALMDDFWKYDRPLPNGILNGSSTAFITTKRIVKQIEIRVPFGDINSFDGNDLVTTFLGDGEVESAEYNLSAEQLILTLLHEQ